MLDIFSWGYILFTVAVVALYWLAVPVRFRPHFLMLAGLLVVLNQPPALVIVTAIYLGLTWYFGNAIHNAEQRSTKKFFTILGICISVLLLFFFKYFIFGDVHLRSLAGSAGSDFAAKLAPLGISYFVFRVIHYLVEINRGTFPKATLVDFLLYITFFPTLLAGPIDRFENFQPQREQNASFDSNDLLYGGRRILQGLFKKLVISATLFEMCTPYYTAVNLQGDVVLSTGQIWLIHNLYFVYLYMDFSGYSDIAIGTARLFGYRIMENFNWPLLQPSIARFWANWHISLTRWLGQYIYIALGGNRKGMFRAAIYSFITMGAFGLWHGSGASMGHYILFGCYHAAFIVAYRFWRKFRKERLPNLKSTKIGYALGVVATTQVVCLGWPLFLHPTAKAISIYAKTFGIDFNMQKAMFQFFAGLMG